jgi:hypothetical protein
MVDEKNFKDKPLVRLIRIKWHRPMQLEAIYIKEIKKYIKYLCILFAILFSIELIGLGMMKPNQYLESQTVSGASQMQRSSSGLAPSTEVDDTSAIIDFEENSTNESLVDKFRSQNESRVENVTYVAETAKAEAFAKAEKLKSQPGFEAVLAIIGFLASIYLVQCRK